MALSEFFTVKYDEGVWPHLEFFAQNLHTKTNMAMITATIVIRAAAMAGPIGTIYTEGEDTA